MNYHFFSSVCSGGVSPISSALSLLSPVSFSLSPSLCCFVSISAVVGGASAVVGGTERRERERRSAHNCVVLEPSRVRCVYYELWCVAANRTGCKSHPSRWTEVKS